MKNIRFIEISDTILSIFFACLIGDTYKEMIVFGVLYFLFCTIMRFRYQFLKEDK